MIRRKQLRVVGRSPDKVDALAKATGRALYADDLRFPGMLYGKLLRSPWPHARVLKVDADAARALPGVCAVLTGKDLPIRYGIIPSSQDETALAVDKVRYVGEAVAAVCARTEEIAEEALGLIRVEYEPLPPVLSMQAAMNGSSAPVHEKGNLHKVVSLEFGDDSVSAEEPEYAREDSFFYEGNTHLPLEEQSAVAMRNKGGLIMYSSTQTPFLLRKIVAKALDLSEENVRVIAPKVGGGFGGKLDAFAHDICAAKLALVTGSPVKFTLTREEVFYCHRGRHPSLMRIKTAWRRNGELRDLHFSSCLDGGAYGSFGVVCTYYQGALQPTTYRIPHYRFDAARFFTNKPPCGPKRGHGIPQPRFSLEVHLDKVAEDLGIDPVELRLKNLVEPNTTTVNQLRVTSCGLRECVEKVAEASGFRRRFGKMPAGRGLGFALGSYLCGAAVPIYWNDEPHSGARITVDRRGEVTVFSGATDIGQGSDTVIVSVVAEVLGIAPEKIRLVAADTGLTPLDLGTYSSRVTYMAGNAARDAAEKLMAGLAKAVGNRKLPFEQMVKEALGKQSTLEAWGAYKPPEKLGKFKGSGVGPSPAYSFSACVAEVECDAGTGGVRVDKIYFAHDIGRAIHRSSVEGQIEGGIHMALGEALLEEHVFHSNGLHKKPGILDYKFLSAAEMPELDIFLVETEGSGGPFGAKEVGQGPLIPVIPAVANAIHDALGVRIDETPFTPEKILLALRKKASGGEPRVGPEAFSDFRFPEPVRVEPLKEEVAC